ncbi:MAG: hypothetical protein RR609_07090 [Aurantimicrobium sp.]
MESLMQFFSVSELLGALVSALLVYLTHTVKQHTKSHDLLWNTLRELQDRKITCLETFADDEENSTAHARFQYLIDNTVNDLQNLNGRVITLEQYAQHKQFNG